MAETTEEKTAIATEPELDLQIIDTDPKYSEWYRKLLNELRDIVNREGKAILPYRYQMGKAIRKARQEWDKTHPPTGPDGWTVERHRVMTRLKHDLGTARSDLYASLRFVELGLRRKEDGWKSFEEFSEKRFSVERGDSPKGETRVRGKDLTWKEVKEQVLRGKKRAKTESQQSAAESGPTDSRDWSSSPASGPIPPPVVVMSPSNIFSIPLPVDVLQRFRQIAKPSAEEVLANYVQSFVANSKPA